jgi:hypothetical protein
MKKFINILTISMMVYFISIKSANAQVDTIRLKDKRLNTSALKPGLNQYLVYFQTTAKPKSLVFWFWLRDIKIETRNGAKVFTISQHWYGSDTVSYRQVYSVNRVEDFAPVYHAETIKNISKAYNWYHDKITGADSIANNPQKTFSLNFTVPNFNWNLDIETFEMLPLAAGKTFAINFYDAGLEPPAYVNYKVTGDEVLTTLNNDHVDCWKLFTETDYKGTHYTETYWISKKGHEFLKEEDTYPGGYRYKLKMLGSATDIFARFGK